MEVGNSTNNKRAAINWYARWLYVFNMLSIAAGAILAGIVGLVWSFAVWLAYVVFTTEFDYPTTIDLFWVWIYGTGALMLFVTILIISTGPPEPKQPARPRQPLVFREHASRARF